MATNGLEAFLFKSHPYNGFLETWGSAWLQEAEQKKAQAKQKAVETASKSVFSRIYGTQFLVPIAPKPKPAPKTLPDIEVRPSSANIAKIEQCIFKNLSLKDFLELKTVSRSFNDDFYQRIHLIKMLQESPLHTMQFPSSDEPYIPINYTEAQIIEDEKQQLDLTVLSLASRLKLITADTMNRHTMMRGQIENAPYYLIRFRTKNESSTSTEGVLILFEFQSQIFVIDPTEQAIKSYHAGSPINLKHVQHAIKDLIVQKKTFAYKMQKNLSLKMSPQKIALWKPIETKTSSPQTYSYNLLFLRTALTALTVFTILNLLQFHRPYSIGTALLTGGCNLIHGLRSSSAVERQALIDAYSEIAPPAKAMRTIASDEQIIQALIKKHSDLDKPSNELKSLLCYCKDKKIRKLLMDHRANPMMYNECKCPLLEAIEKEEIETLKDYLEYQPPFHMSESLQREIAEKASASTFDLVLSYRPDFNLNATNEDEEIKLTALETLFKNVCSEPIYTEEDLSRTKATFNKIAHLIKRGAKTDSIEKAINQMKALEKIHYKDLTIELNPLLGTNPRLAWLNAKALAKVWDALSQINYN